MEAFELIFRFEDEERSLSLENGLSINLLADFLKSLSRAVMPDAEDKIVLTSLRSNSYAPVLTTKSKVQFEAVKTLHGEIASGYYDRLNTQQKAYLKTLSNLLRNGVTLNVYDEKKEFYKTISNLNATEAFPYHYETNAYKGYLTRIGSRNMNAQNTIFVSSYPNEVQIDMEQEVALREHYKKGLLEFYVTEKINKETGRADSAVLDSFQVMEKGDAISFLHEISTLREKYGEYFIDTDLSSDDD